MGTRYCHYHEGVLTVTYKVLRFVRTRSYDVDLIRDFRLAPENAVAAGAFQFEYGGKTVAIVPHLNSSQAKVLMSRLSDLPYLRTVRKGESHRSRVD
jgi:hypothetical protein